MPGQLILSGGAAGMPAGAWIAGPQTASGSKATPEIVNVELENGVEKKLALPPEAVQWALFFQFQTSPPVVKVRTNQNSADGGIEVPAQGFFSKSVNTGETELLLKAASAPKVFQLVVV